MLPWSLKVTKGAIKLFLAWILSCLLSSFRNTLSGEGHGMTHSARLLHHHRRQWQKLGEEQACSCPKGPFQSLCLASRGHLNFATGKADSESKARSLLHGFTRKETHLTSILSVWQLQAESKADPIWSSSSDLHTQNLLVFKVDSLVSEPIKYTYHSDWNVLENKESQDELLIRFLPLHTHVHTHTRIHTHTHAGGSGIPHILCGLHRVKKDNLFALNSIWWMANVLTSLCAPLLFAFQESLNQQILVKSRNIWQA